MSKKHYKLYKSGKQWLTMGITIASLAFGITMATDAQADVVTQNNAASTTQVAQSQQVVGSATVAASYASTNSNATSASANIPSAQPASTSSSATNIAGQTSSSTSVAQNGLVKENGNTYYYNNNAKVTNEWEQVNNNWYYFGNEGNAQIGWYQSQAGFWYYFNDETAQAETGWQKINNNWYHFDETNANASTGWYQSNAGFWYYFDQSNAWAEKGWQKINNNWYYFDDTNANALTGWQKINNNWYHFDESNAMANTGWYKSNAGFWYYFDNTNAWALTGWQKINNVWYYFDTTNANMLTGTQTVDGKTYNFGSNGAWLDDHSEAVNRAMSMRGRAYVWGGNNPSTGFDCSGLVQWAYGLGSNYRTTYQQQTLGIHHYDVANAPKGALLFFGSDSAPYHVAVSLGNGSYVHAPEPGDVIKVGYTKYYSASYYVVL